ncbi:dTMP kinase [Candidatus Shapirobacteria bacterium]|nr:dTMP kinase [Candidatus Shapirobacteria bacterium]
MKLNPYPGFFIDIEGLDGSGANTQVKLVTEELRKLGLEPYLTKEPTDGPVGKLIHEILKKDPASVSPTALRLLFAADGCFHLEDVVIPRLEKGGTVITDRYAWSSVAYGAVHLPKEWLFELNRDFIMPDLTVFIDVSPEVCLERLAKERGGLALFKEQEELELAWDTYHWLANKYWWAEIAAIDGERGKEAITTDIIKLIKAQPKFKKLIKK